MLHAALLLLAGGCRVPPVADDTEVDFTWDSAAPVAFAESPRGESVRPLNDARYEPVAEDLIDAATERVWAIEYLLYDSGGAGRLLGALEHAAQRGVDVRVLADEAGWETPASLDSLVAAGAEAKLDSPATTTHNKLLIIDGATLVGSHNFTSAALGSNAEASAWVDIPEVTAFYADFFEAMWQDSDRPARVRRPGAGPVVPLVNREVYPALRSCLDGATRRVDLAMYAVALNPGFPDSEVARLVEGVEQAHARGVSVRVALDDSDWIAEHAINVAATDRLVAAGVPVRLTPSSRTHHAKVLRCDQTVIVSDANWSYSGLVLYNGTSLQVTGPLADAYGGWFEQIWNASAPAD